MPSRQIQREKRNNQQFMKYNQSSNCCKGFLFMGNQEHNLMQVGQIYKDSIEEEKHVLCFIWGYKSLLRSLELCI